MSTNVTLGGTLPAEGEVNGLAEIAGALVGKPDDLIVAVVVLGVKHIKTDIETSAITPTLRVRRIEPITDDEDRQSLGPIANRAFERRTGKAVLPLELKDELRDVFEGGDE